MLPPDSWPSSCTISFTDTTNNCTMTPNSLYNHSKGLPASAEQAVCPNPLSYIISKLSPQMSCSAGPSNEENSQRKRDSEFVEDEIQALIERVDNSISEWRSN
ncbi:hypothetical protein HZ326_11672 [Fusarium oxysporum f. sp. albedinis]|nr:hypothetical protein HZ326_11672 [Fusarium oxysporum f. sp. albedinis]